VFFLLFLLCFEGGTNDMLLRVPVSSKKRRPEASQKKVMTPKMPYKNLRKSILPDSL